ncbi:hypothetical protein LVD17_12700 [Fulvivirga ulvae]|uniref:imm11 family protein n=1 Tax=Fulvivirga ulvae TaxID=2904245 RepID=UPI001F354F77|nr:DUF1629 domain-containing protein [Fulvivirga ulvae]UII34668.1 hypothetical protein LVD17_12700 [Fulvivirga ulvae]
MNDPELAEISKCSELLEGRRYNLSWGIQSKDWMLEKMEFQLDPDSGVKITDSIPNTLGLKIVSEKLKLILEETALNIEFFEVDIRDAKGKLVESTYYIANLLDVVECMDLKKSRYKRSILKESHMGRIDYLAIREKAIEEKISIFRLAEMPRLHILSEKLGIKIKRLEGCTGMDFIGVEDFSSVTYFL